MTNPDLTLIGILLDRSGSMRAIQDDMENGLKSFLDQQRALGDTDLVVAHFDSEYDLLFPITPLEDAPEIDLIPRGLTALNDAVGKFVTYVGEQLAALPEEERPGTVIINIITDGFENASKEWSLTSVRELIDQQQNDYGWNFIFMGSDVSVDTQASDYGIKKVVRSATEGVDCGSNSMAMFTRNIRTGKTEVFDRSSRDQSR